MDNSLFPVGEYLERFNGITGNSLPVGMIYQSTGLQIHILKRHPHLLGYLSKIPEIILSPDYIGIHPNEPNSIELVKRYAENIQIAIKLDIDKNYLYVASLYEIKEARLKKRIHSGRLKKVY